MNSNQRGELEERGAIGSVWQPGEPAEVSDPGEHEDVRGRLAAYSAGMLDGVEWLTVRTHVAECELCRSELARPVVWNRASPQRILPAGVVHVAGRPERGAATALRNLPHWAVLFLAALVAGVITYGATQPF
ncbi:hypothetical protein HUO13_30420 [Saccharopolyspora erythraea]|uniref:hypothetical protein n=1 Tax=Saccharopolyspora erythraea TaxID=1836 RepID=UPI001BAB9BE7|nr:hypothetical protein [Saccharopolyspora erythraea]QUH04518.1 hypothetical protein HUO13_30420 [Saccharopolyspora erythraea]